jgi:hypothetical protein
MANSASYRLTYTVYRLTFLESLGGRVVNDGITMVIFVWFLHAMCHVKRTLDVSCKKKSRLRVVSNETNSSSFKIFPTEKHIKGIDLDFLTEFESQIYSTAQE